MHFHCQKFAGMNIKYIYCEMHTPKVIMCGSNAVANLLHGQTFLYNFASYFL